MFAHGDDDVREPVYDLTSPPAVTVEYSNASVAGIAVEKTATVNEQTYHLDPKWSGKFLTAIKF